MRSSGVKFFLIILIVILVPSTASASTTISSRIKATRIVVVDQQGTITDIYSNTHDDQVSPNYIYADGRQLEPESSTNNQYYQIISRHQNGYGHIYHGSPSLWRNVFNAIKSSMEPVAVILFKHNK